MYVLGRVDCILFVLDRFNSAWVGLDAVFRADSEYHIKKILKNGLGGAQALSKFEF